MDPLFLADDRVLVLGATGWFGRTFLSLVPRSLEVLPVTRMEQPGFETYGSDRITAFAPTVVANFAFLTRDRLSDLGVKEFTRTNERLTAEFITAAKLPTVRLAITVSSGATVTEPQSPYGSLKRIEESESLALASSQRAIVVVRAYSVSGPYVRRPRAYAFSDMVLQADSGAVEVLASALTYRRYVDVGDALVLALADGLDGRSGVFETGGELVEMSDLAERVIAQVNPDASLVRGMIQGDSSTYASDGRSWSEVCARHSFAPLVLDEQIRSTAAGLLESPR